MLKIWIRPSVGPMGRGGKGEHQNYTVEAQWWNTHRYMEQNPCVRKKSRGTLAWCGTVQSMMNKVSAGKLED